MPAVGALLGKAAAVGAKTGAKAKLGSAAKGLAKDIAIDAGTSIAQSAASIPGKVVNSATNAAKSTVSDEGESTHTESYRNHSFADSYAEVLKLQEARAKTREEARAKLAAHSKAMKEGGVSPYSKKPAEGAKKAQKDPWMTHPDDVKAARKGYSEGGEVKGFPESSKDKKINARVDKYNNK